MLGNLSAIVALLSFIGMRNYQPSNKTLLSLQLLMCAGVAVVFIQFMKGFVRRMLGM
ncbi:hypothetical protein [Terribacillus halophilus]|jgi:hypothetical protein|uniref:hypothetical protein n=1 Tax=Terribacillus halophilus TaxID=361279 RepID=UPI001C4DE8F3|nr:hypothetical protein [Terribacillus halophilus]